MKFRDEVFGGEITGCGVGWGILQAVKAKDTEIIRKWSLRAGFHSSLPEGPSAFAGLSIDL